MNIGIVCYPTYGGSGVVATELGIALAQKGHQVHFITSHQPVKLNFLTHNLHFHEVFVENYPLFHYQPYNLALSSKLVESVEKYDLDVLHVHYAIPHAYAAYMAKQMLKGYWNRYSYCNNLTWYRYHIGRKPSSLQAGSGIQHQSF